MVARGRENDRRWTIRGYISTFGLAGARFDGYICCFEPLGLLGLGLGVRSVLRLLDHCRQHRNV